MWHRLPSVPHEPQMWGPHLGQPVLVTGAPNQMPRLAVIMLHGRGEMATSILLFHRPLARPDTLFVAPQAAHRSWYPGDFSLPLERNEPYISSGIALLELVRHRLAGLGIPSSRLVWLGFSQGAALMLEYVLRHPQRYGAIIALSGAILGPPDRPHHFSGSLEGTPVFLGCSEADFHISLDQVKATAATLQDMGGQVTLRLYPGLDHAINQDEIRAIRDLLAQVAASQEGEKPLAHSG